MPTPSMPAFSSGPGYLGQGGLSSLLAVEKEGPPFASVVGGLVPARAHVE